MVNSMLTSVVTYLTSAEGKETKLVRIKRSNNQVVQDCTFYIGRAINRGGWKLPQSRYYNPNSLNVDEREAVLLKYLEHIYNKGLVNTVLELEGHTLGCWCLPERCHGEVLLAVLALAVMGNEGTLIPPPMETVKEVLKL